MFQFIPKDNVYKDDNIVDILTVPEQVQALEGYGEGFDEEYYNQVIWNPGTGEKKYIKNVKTVKFTGEEAWQASQYQLGEGTRYDCDFSSEEPPLSNEVLCTHFPYQGSNNKGVWVNADPGVQLLKCRIQWEYDSGDALKAYLSAQNEAGTPVTILYILSTPEITELSHILPDENYIKSVPNGQIDFDNENRQAVPAKIQYVISNA